MSKYVSFDIENLEPIKLGNTLGQIDSDSSKSYITGAAIRGAFIANYLSLNNLDDIVNEDREFLLKGGIEFFNAYPSINGNRALPLFKNLYTTKESLKEFSTQTPLMLVDKNNEAVAAQKVKGVEFASYNFNNNEIVTSSIEKITKLHIRKDTDNKLFRYEGIREGNIFKAIIKCKEQYIDNTLEVLDKGLFYVGGSKGSGYGRCRVLNVEVTDYNPEISLVKNNSFAKNEFFFVATSDIIMRNNLGEFTNCIDAELIKEKLALKEVFYEEAFIDTEIFTGFNNKWGYRLPLLNGINGGSIIKYKFTGNLDVEKMVAFANEGIGERKQEGFGRFVLCPSIEFEKITKIRNSVEIVDAIELTNTEKEEIKKMVNSIFLNKLDRRITEKVVELSKKVENRDKIKVSQWGKLKELIIILHDKNMEEGLKFLNEFFEHIESKKINRDLVNALKFIKIERKEFKKFLLEVLSDDNINNFYRAYQNQIRVGGIKSEITIEEMYRYKLKVFKGLFTMHLKRGKR